MALSLVPQPSKKPAWSAGRTFLPALPDWLAGIVRNELTFRNPAWDMRVKSGQPLEGVKEYIQLWVYWEPEPGVQALVVPRYYWNHLLDPYTYRSAIPSDGAGLTFSMQFQPRDNQLDVVAWLEGHPGDIGLKLPCGFGKTYLALLHCSQHPGRTLVVLPNNERLGGWREAILEHTDLQPEQIGHVQGPKRVWEDCPITLAMLKTMSMQDFPQEFLGGFTNVIWDEIHLASAVMMSQALGKVNGRQIGLSATPGSGVRRKVITNHLGETWMSQQQSDARPLTVHFMRVGVPKFLSGGDGKAEFAWRNQKHLIAKNRRYSEVAAMLTKSAVDDGRRVLVLNDAIQPLVQIGLECPDMDFGFVIGQQSLRNILDIHFPKIQETIDAQEGTTIGTRISNYLKHVKNQCNPILATGLKKNQPGGMGMDVADLSGGVVMFPTPNPDMTTQLAGRWRRAHATKKDPLLVVMVPNTPRGIEAAERMASTLERLPNTTIIFNNNLL